MDSYNREVLARVLDPLKDVEDIPYQKYVMRTLKEENAIAVEALRGFCFVSQMTIDGITNDLEYPLSRRTGLDFIWQALECEMEYVDCEPLVKSVWIYVEADKRNILPVVLKDCPNLAFVGHIFANYRRHPFIYDEDTKKVILAHEKLIPNIREGFEPLLERVCELLWENNISFRIGRYSNVGKV